MTPALTSISVSVRNTRKRKRPGQGQRRRARQRLQRANRANHLGEDSVSALVIKKPPRRPNQAARKRASRRRLALQPSGSASTQDGPSFPGLVLSERNNISSPDPIITIPALIFPPVEGLPRSGPYSRRICLLPLRNYSNHVRRF